MEDGADFKALYDKIIESYIANRGIPDELQALEETIDDILTVVERGADCSEDVATAEQVLHKILLLGMSIGRRIGDADEQSPSRTTVEMVDKSTQSDHAPAMVPTSELPIDLGKGMDQPTTTTDVVSDPSHSHIERSCSVPDDGAEHVSMPAEDAGKPDIAVELAETDQTYSAPSQTKKPRGWRLSWKRIKRVALRLCCVR
ncbi:unnamed protein product [Aphis gossypii]|uniref:Uncharacterized protein n=1 Tax=Aphis gossypii TaxID=80765 RepID=A0A9P0JCG6_APHGO|nr:unnamed protein product [Aphis gossypii]